MRVQLAFCHKGMNTHSHTHTHTHTRIADYRFFRRCSPPLAGSTVRWRCFPVFTAAAALVPRAACAGTPGGSNAVSLSSSVIGTVSLAPRWPPKAPWRDPWAMSRHRRWCGLPSWCWPSPSSSGQVALLPPPLIDCARNCVPRVQCSMRHPPPSPPPRGAAKKPTQPMLSSVGATLICSPQSRPSTSGRLFARRKGGRGMAREGGYRRHACSADATF